MTYVDSALLDLAEWFCRRFQVLTGKTNVWLAVQLTNVSVVVYFVWAGLVFWRSNIVARVFAALFCSGVFYLLTVTIFKDPIELHENNAYRRAAKGVRNPRRIRDAFLRISFLTLSIMLSYPVMLVYVDLRVHLVLLTYSLIVLTTVMLYLLACDPLPPCPAKLLEWFRITAAAASAARTVDRKEPTCASDSSGHG